MPENDKQPSVVAVTDDMFFSSRILEAAKAAEVGVEFIRGTDGFPDRYIASSPRLFIVDLNSKKINAMDVIRMIKSTEALSGTPVIGYFSHVDTDLRKRAIESGYDAVMPRSKFVKDLGIILSDAARAVR